MWFIQTQTKTTSTLTTPKQILLQKRALFLWLLTFLKVGSSDWKERGRGRADLKPCTRGVEDRGQRKPNQENATLSYWVTTTIQKSKIKRIIIHYRCMTAQMKQLIWRRVNMGKTAAKAVIMDIYISKHRPEIWRIRPFLTQNTSSLDPPKNYIKLTTINSVSYPHFKLWAGLKFSCNKNKNLTHHQNGLQFL